MALTLVTEATEEPVSLEDVKSHLRLDTSDDDGYVYSCLTAAREWVEGQTKRGIVTQTWDYAIDYGWPWKFRSHRIDLPLNPVASVTSVTYVDTNGASQTLATSQYTVLARMHGSYIVPAYDVTWPDVRSVPEAITVRFVVGEAQPPEDLKRAVTVLAGHYYEMRETSAGAPDAVEALISPYRSPRF